MNISLRRPKDLYLRSMLIRSDRGLLAFSLAILLITTSFSHAKSMPDKIITFGNSLYQEKDYYRAITEYKRFLHFYPNHSKASQIEFQIGFSYLKGEKWDAAIPYFQKLHTSPLKEEALFALAQAYFHAKRYELAIHEWNQFLESYSKSPLRDKAYYQKGWAYFLQEKMTEASQDFSKIKTSPLENKAQSLSKEITQWNEKPYRSPLLAGFLSALFPGLGQWYDGRFWDGVSALIVNGMFAYGIYATFRDEHYPSTGILIFLGSGFYGGNIFSAVSSAHKFNRNVKESIWTNLKNKYAIKLEWTGSTLIFNF